MFSPTTLLERRNYKKARELTKEDMHATNPFTVFINQLKSPLRVAFPKATGGEQAAGGVQASWSKALQVRPQGVLLKWQTNKKAPTQLCDTHEGRWFKGKGPDCVLFGKGLPKNELFSSVAVLELKGTASLNDLARENVEGYNEILLAEQPWRTYCFGLLTNNEAVWALHSAVQQRDGAPVVVHTWFFGQQCSTPEAEAFLSAFLLAPLDVLGYNPPSVRVSLLSPKQPRGTHAAKPVKLGNHLGAGRVCEAYEATLDGKTVVAKHFSKKQQFTTERNTLLELHKKNVLNVPLLVAQNEDECWMVVTPVGHHFGSLRDLDFDQKKLMTPSHIRSLVKTLFAAHSCGIVHRDPRCSNLFLQSESEDALLNDWGEAAEQGKPVQFMGAIKEAAPDVLQALLKGNTLIVPEFHHDLYILARTVYCLFFRPPLPHKFDDKAKFQDVISFWETRSKPWQTVFSAAEEVAKLKGARRSKALSAYDMFSNALVEAILPLDMPTWSDRKDGAAKRRKLW
jgi:hypothetical protein